MTAKFKVKYYDEEQDELFEDSGVVFGKDRYDLVAHLVTCYNDIDILIVDFGENENEKNFVRVLNRKEIKEEEGISFE